MKDYPWIQAAIDVADIELARKIAFMALDAGAEWLEVGTPLLYQYGHSAIGTLRKAVGKEVVLVADYKSPFAGLCAAKAAKEGADYVMLTSGYSDWATEHSIACCKEVGIEPIFEVTVHPNDMCSHVEKLVQMGANYVYTRHYSLLKDEHGTDIKIDNIRNIMKAKGDFILGITSDDLEEAQSAVRSGATWITFGWVLRDPNPIICKKWIDAIHSTRREGNKLHVHHSNRQRI